MIIIGPHGPHQKKYKISCENNNYAFKVTTVFVKSWKNATEQHDQGSKTNENACIKFECAFICLNLYYIIHCTSVCDEDEY